jgi:hypothetical protein
MPDLTKRVKCKKHDQYYIKEVVDNGCSICKIKKNKTIKPRSKAWSYAKWRDDGIASSNFDSFKIYIIRCFNDTEEFFKIGKTFTVVDKRLVNLPYKYEVILMYSNSALYISRLEKKLHNANSKFKYKPLLSFTGEHECFSKVEGYDEYKKKGFHVR